MKRSSVDIGKTAEDTARKHLEQSGYSLIKANFHSRFGEIDLVMRNATILVFVEVRYRTSTSYGTPAETIGVGKLRRIIRTAEYFLLMNPRFTDLEMRFDVVSLSEQLEWIQGAFTLNDIA
jgi:putative endonuclease